MTDVHKETDGMGGMVVADKLRVRKPDTGQDLMLTNCDDN